MKMPMFRTKADITRARSVASAIYQAGDFIEHFAETAEEKRIAKFLTDYADKVSEAARKLEAEKEKK